MKIQRPGYTETTLAFLEYLGENNNKKEEMINWLYTTSGFYDKQIKGSYFDYDTKKILGSQNYQNFIKEYTVALKNSDQLCPLFHPTNYEYKEKEFIEYLKPKSLFYWENYREWYKILKNKKLLLINSFSPLMKQQYDCGNIHKIDIDFPVVSELIAYRTPYTFFNNGPHSNFFETLEKIKSDILSIDFDIAIIACGAYAVPLCDYCHNISKIGISIGSIMHRMFGIDPDNKNSKLWINKIPTEYIPKNYEKIEKGRYWLGLNNRF